MESPPDEGVNDNYITRRSSSQLENIQKQSKLTQKYTFLFWLPALFSQFISEILSSNNSGTNLITPTSRIASKSFCTTATGSHYTPYPVAHHLCRFDRNQLLEGLLSFAWVHPITSAKSPLTDPLRGDFVSLFAPKPRVDRVRILILEYQARLLVASRNRTAQHIACPLPNQLSACCPRHKRRRHCIQEARNTSN
jgi:hypothetical protein